MQWKICWCLFEFFFGTNREIASLPASKNATDSTDFTEIEIILSVKSVESVAFLF